MTCRPTSAIHGAIVAAIVAWALSFGSTGVAQDGIVAASYFFIRNHGNPKLFLHNRGGEPVASPIAPPECPGGQWRLSRCSATRRCASGTTRRTSTCTCRTASSTLARSGRIRLPRDGLVEADGAAALWCGSGTAQSGLYLALHEIPGPLTAVPIDPDRDPEPARMGPHRGCRLLRGCRLSQHPRCGRRSCCPDVCRPFGCRCCSHHQRRSLPDNNRRRANATAGEAATRRTAPSRRPASCRHCSRRPTNFRVLTRRCRRKGPSRRPTNFRVPTRRCRRRGQSRHPEIPRRPPPPPKTQYPELPELVDTPPGRRPPRGPTIRGGLTFDGSPVAKRPIVRRPPVVRTRKIVQRPPNVRPRPAPRPRVIPPRRSPRAR